MDNKKNVFFFIAATIVVSILVAVFFFNENKQQIDIYGEHGKQIDNIVLDSSDSVVILKYVLNITSNEISNIDVRFIQDNIKNNIEEPIIFYEVDESNNDYTVVIVNLKYDDNSLNLLDILKSEPELVDMVVYLKNRKSLSLDKSINFEKFDLSEYLIINN